MTRPAPLIDPRTYDQIVQDVEQSAQDFTAVLVDIQKETLRGAMLHADVLQASTGKPYAFQYVPEDSTESVNVTLSAGLRLDDNTRAGEAALERLLNLKRAGSVNQVSIRRWSPPPDPAMDAGKMLTRMFARMAAIAVDRLNRVPDKHFLRFLNLIGANFEPPQPARVPLTFYLAEGSSQPVRVPAATQVAAPADESGLAEAIFETESELTVVPNELVGIFCRVGWFRDGKLIGGSYADYSRTGTVPGYNANFVANQPLEYTVYISDDSVLIDDRSFFDQIEYHTLEIIYKPSMPSGIQWSAWDGKQWIALPATGVGSDRTRIEKLPRLLPESPNIPPDAPVERAWLKGTFLLTKNNQLVNGTPLDLQVRLIPSSDTLRVDTAFANNQPLDLSKPFYPFGETPRVTDTFYFALDKAFAQLGARISLKADLANIPDAKNVNIVWEYWDTKEQSWSNLAGWVKARTDEKTDEMLKLAISEEMLIRRPPNMGQLKINDQLRHWIRLRVDNGTYGTHGGFDEKKNFEPPKYNPPLLKTIQCTIQSLDSQDVLMSYILYGNFRYTKKQLSPEMRYPTETAPTLYFAFDRPFPNRPVNIYFELANNPSARGAGSTLVWEYCSTTDGRNWSPLTVQDRTQALLRRGTVTFIGPDNMQPTSDFGITAYWVRARLEKDNYIDKPEISHILLNTAWASQAITIKQELLGSSTGQKDQVFEITLQPVLTGQQVEVFEVDQLSAAELLALHVAEGEDAVTPEPDGSGYWVRWHETPDFYASGRQDRHYTLDHLTGALRFGDGRHGRVPIPGRNNLRITYRSGGGDNGNRAPNMVNELKSALAYIDRVTNVVSASGGAEVETLDQARQRGPTLLRHQGRAVVAQDYEDLALLASSQVARARAFIATGSTDAGNVRVMIAAHNKANPPRPSAELLNQVRDYLRARCDPTVQIQVIEPIWLKMDVEASIALTSFETGDTPLAVEQALRAFLHPITGGADGKGWPFGRLPNDSDVYRVIESVQGVDHVERLKLQPSTPGTPADGALIYPGTIRVQLVGRSESE